MDLKPLCKAVLFHSSTKGTTVHRFVLIIPLLFFKALSHMYLYRTTRLLRPWDSPGKNTGVGCHFFLQGNLPDPVIKPRSPALEADALTSEPPGKPPLVLLILAVNHLLGGIPENVFSLMLWMSRDQTVGSLIIKALSESLENKSFSWRAGCNRWVQFVRCHHAVRLRSRHFLVACCT